MSSTTVNSKLSKELRQMELYNTERDLEAAKSHDKYYLKEIKKLQKLRNENEHLIGYLANKIEKLKSVL